MALGVGLMLVVALGGACGGKKHESTGQLALKWRVAKPCVRPGDRQEVVTKAVPRANVAYAIIYADEKVRGDPPHGDADSSGTFKASWVVPTDAPAGEVRVRILAVSERRTGSVIAPFKIASAEKPCS